jgi:GLPGLI family protein
MQTTMQDDQNFYRAHIAEWYNITGKKNMKKICLVLSLIVLTKTYSNAQAPTQKGLVVYNYVFVMDTAYTLLGLETESFLYFDTEKQQSVYVWNRKSTAKSKEMMKNSDGSVYMKVKNGSSDPIGNIVFKNYKNNNIVERKGKTETKIISDSFSISWQISEETKTIKDMVLQKAECDFRGRHYTAWFNPKIPVSDGPWKLRGLPGLIIEAYDEMKHVQFNFTSLTIPAEFTEKIEAPSDGTPVVYDCVKFTENHYKRVKELRSAILGKVEQMGGSVNNNEKSRTNLIERCY